MTYDENKISDLIDNGQLQQRIEYGNRTIAEFEGWKSGLYSNLPNRVHRTINTKQQGIDIDQLKYYCDWNELMRVIKKIKDYLNNLERPSQNHYCKGDVLEVDIQCALWEINIEKTWQFVIVFIEWYNSTKNSNNELDKH